MPFFPSPSLQVWLILRYSKCPLVCLLANSPFYFLSLQIKSRNLVKPETAAGSGICTTSDLNLVKVRSYYNEAVFENFATRSRYGGRNLVTALPGDGIGPEMLGHVRKIFKLVAVQESSYQAKKLSPLMTLCFPLSGLVDFQWTLKRSNSTPFTKILRT